MTRNVVIFGATGAQGAPVVREALRKGLTVRAVARSVEKAVQLHPGAEVVHASLDDEDSIARALDGAAAAFLHLPMPRGPKDPQNWLHCFIAAAHRASLPLLVYTTSGPTGSRYASSVVIDGGTASMQAVQNCGIPSIILQPAVYLENLQPPFFVPKLRSEGILDYPPLPANTRVQWTSHEDQARIAVAALSRPDLAGSAYEIGSPGPLTGNELASVVSHWLGRDVLFRPMSPGDFGQRVSEATGNPGVAFALTDLYSSMEKLEGNDMVVDTDSIERTFGVTLTSAADHIAAWSQQ